MRASGEAISRAAAALARYGLGVVGAFHPDASDGSPEGTGTLVLVGGQGDAMWRIFTQSPEFVDGRPDPLDRWSRRVIEDVATGLDARALFPFGGPPWLPFPRWAERGEGARPSPVAMLVSASRGLWLSYRGALAFPDRLALAPPASGDPCRACPQPCRSACPVGAFTAAGYDLARCLAHVRSRAGRACHEEGCRVRHACPAGAAARPSAAQCRFHMEALIASHDGG